jgi:hypothetical protein
MNAPIQNLADVPSLFAPDGLARLSAFEGYAEAKPYPHLVLDNLFNPAALHTIIREWPTAGEVEVHNDGTFTRAKFGTTWKSEFGIATRSYFAEFAGAEFLQILQWVTGIHGLLADPYMYGGGLHATAVGGKLAVHADYNKHPLFKLDRRLNLLIYLNEDWTEDNAGWLELWDADMTACAKRVLPVFNRTVLFNTTRTSYHGQPEPIVGPPTLSRKSIALYYFSNGRSDESDTAAHSTLWQERPALGY